MDDGLKKRLLGATVLVSLAVIFVPMLLEKEPADESGIGASKIPLPPEDKFSSRILPLESEDLSRPPAQIIPLKQDADESGERETGPKEILALKPEKIPEPKPQVESVAPDKPPETEPEEREVLPKKPAPPPANRVSTPAWVVQVGSFSNRTNADKIAVQLKKKGFSSFIERADINGNRVYRVRVGPETSKSKAERMLAKLDQELKVHKLKGSLKRYP